MWQTRHTRHKQVCGKKETILENHSITSNELHVGPTNLSFFLLTTKDTLVSQQELHIQNRRHRLHNAFVALAT